MHAKLDTYVLFLDIEKAYDTVWRAGLLYNLWNKGIKGRMFRVLAQMIDKPTSIVLHNGQFSAPFHPDMGWEQGDTLATTMFNVHIDTILEEVWETHPGVPIPTTSDNTFQKLVALMYADDFGGLADSPENMMSLINSIRMALTKWRLKASVKSNDGSKTAILVVKGGTQAYRNREIRRGQRTHTWHWGNIEIPQVTSYKYLGVWISEAGTWEEHINKRIDKANGNSHLHHNIMSHRQLPWKLRKLTLYSAVQPTLTYSCQIWMNSSTHMREKLDRWHMQIVRRIAHCKPTSQGTCIQQELGIMPLHMMCDVWTLAYWHQLRTHTKNTLVSTVFKAWPLSHNPWLQNVHKLLTEYNINAEQTRHFQHSKFVRYLKERITNKLYQSWGNDSNRRNSATLSRYIESYGKGIIQIGRNGAQPSARKYFSTLTQQKRGLPAELIMGLRTECISLRCIKKSQRKNETIVQQLQRESCPHCSTTAETPSHFILQCPAYVDARNIMFDALQQACPEEVAKVKSLPQDQAWRQLLSDGFLDNADSLAAVASFVMAAWQLRNTALTGRETNGGNSMV
jgi:hypothetical protein